MPAGSASRKGGEGEGGRGRERERDGWREGRRDGWMDGGRERAMSGLPGGNEALSNCIPGTVRQSGLLQWPKQKPQTLILNLNPQTKRAEPLAQTKRDTSRERSRELTDGILWATVEEWLASAALS